MFAVQAPTFNAAVRRFPAPVVDLEPNTQSCPAESVQRSLLPLADILACPRCNGGLVFLHHVLECQWCGSRYPADSGIPRLFFPHDVRYGPRDVTHNVNAFYDANPFPIYSQDESRDSFRAKSLASPLARHLDEQLPANSLILDAGCGTGQLANFLGLRKDRQVIGGDLSLNSLRLAKDFKDGCAFQNTSFLQMNLFRPPFRARVFDVVIAANVLHHTSDPLAGFRALANLLKPGGFFVLSVYNTLGRAGNDLRRLFYGLSNDRLAFLNWRNENQRGRFVQRYKQPCESRHGITEILRNWFAANELEFLYSSPRIGAKTLTGGEDLRYPRWPGDRCMQLQTELGMFLRGIVNDGLFVIIGRNKAQPKCIEAPESVQAAHA